MKWMAYLVFVLLLAAKPAAASQTAVPLLPKACEMSLALDAAPEHLRKEASVYVLARTGWEKVQEGSNGFACVVNRDHPRVLKPTCYDAEGARTILPKVLFTGKRLVAGADQATLRKEIAARFDDGRFESPQRAGVAYMLSHYNRPYDPSTDTLGWFGPHVMFYAPDVTPEDIGFSMEAWHRRPLPFVGYQGPHGFFIMMSDDGSERSVDDHSACPDWVRD